MKRAFALATLLIAMPAFAQTPQDAGPYVAGSFGRTNFNDACDDVPGSCDPKSKAWKILAGYRINRVFGVELGYADLGKAHGSATVLGVPVRARVDASAWDLVGVASWPIDQFTLFAKAGLYAGKAKARASAGGASLSETDKGSDFTIGFGGRFDFTRNIGVRIDWQRYTDVGGKDVGKADVDLMTFGVQYRF